MCRMLAIVSNREIDLDLLMRFRQLAVTGKTPDGPPDERGHNDGWGLAAFSHDGVYWRRGATSAVADPGYEEAARYVSSLSAPLMVLAHVRRASDRRTVAESNSHPFLAEHEGETWAFEQNGGFSGYSFESRDMIDSEYFFQQLLSHLKGDVVSALGSTTSDLRSFYPEYSSLTCIFTNGSTLYAYRECGKPERVGYYTLFLAQREHSIEICSEDIWGVECEEIRNGDLVEVKGDLSWRTL